MARPLACVIGDLSLVRALGRRGIPVAVVTSEPDALEVYSRYVQDHVVAPSFVDAPDQAVQAILDWAKRLCERPVLFYQGDHDLLAVSRHRREIEPWMRCVLPPEPLVEDLVDKVRFTALAQERGLPIPMTSVLSSRGAFAELACAWDTFPCVIKPAMRTHWFGSTLQREAAEETQKALRVENRDALERLMPSLAAHETDLLVQAAIEGGEDLLLSYHAYVRPDGEVVAELTGKKRRTRPRRYGVSTCVEITDDAALKRMGRDIVRRLGISGVLKMDFKEDIRDGRRYLLEINPRFSLWHHPATLAGMPLPELVYRDCLDPGSARHDGRVRVGTSWMRATEDLRAVREDGDAGELSPWRWVRELVTTDVNEDFTWADPLPSLVSLGRRVRRVARRVTMRGTPSRAVSQAG